MEIRDETLLIGARDLETPINLTVQRARESHPIKRITEDMLSLE